MRPLTKENAALEARKADIPVLLTCRHHARLSVPDRQVSSRIIAFFALMRLATQSCKRSCPMVRPANAAGSVPPCFGPQSTPNSWRRCWKAATLEWPAASSAYNNSTPICRTRSDCWARA